MRASGLSAWKLKRSTKKTVILLAVVGALAVVLAVLNGIRTIPAVAEWMSTHIAAAHVAVIGRIVSLLPFSVYELFVLLAAAGGIALLALGIAGLVKRKRRAVLNGLLGILIGVLYVCNVYTVTAGFAYYRNRPPVPVATRAYENGEAIAAAAYFAADFAALSEKMERDSNGCARCPYTTRQLSDRLAAEFARMGEYCYDYTPRVKGMTASKLMSALRLTGITFMPFGEPNVNTDAPPSEIPQTMAHEMAHAKGVMREGDANLVSYYLLLTSEDDYLRYCGYYSCYSEMRAAASISGADEAQMEALGYPAAVRAEYAYSSAYWDAQPDIVGKVSEFFNNLYLKLNGAKDGTDSYREPNNWDIIDTGEKDEFERPIYKPIYSELMKVFFAIYDDKNT